MNARKFLDFFKTKTGQITAFGILFFIAACLLISIPISFITSMPFGWT